ncbi:MAG TPA: class I SAM-dependent methyltransferase [Pyrinomonadaceae bacterium]
MSNVLNVGEGPTRQQGEVRDGYRWVAQACPVCEAPPGKYVGRRGGAAHREGTGVECRIWRCRRCDLVFPNPMPLPAGGVGELYALDPDQYFRNHDLGDKLAGARHMVAGASRLTGGPGRLLDVGSGRGDVLVAAREAGWEATGIDLSPSFADYAERRSGAKVFREPIERCGFADGSFDAVILAAVLEHLYDPDATVREIARVLRPGGAFFVDVPNEAGLYFRLGNLYQRLRGRDWVVNVAPTFEPFHVFGFSPRALRALLAKHGLAVRDWRVYGGRSMVPRRGGVLGAAEHLAARAVTAASNLGELGTYIETWAVKSGPGGARPKGGEVSR